MNTLNQLVAKVAELALSHRQIASAWCGDVSEFLRREDVKYPALFFDYPTNRIDRSQRLTIYTLEFWLCDRTGVAEIAKKNEIEVHSDLTLIAEDLIASLCHPELDWLAGDSAPGTYHREQFEDWVAAYRFQFDLGILYTSDRCRIPSDYLFSTLPSAILTESGEFFLSEDGQQITAENPIQ